MGEPPPLRADVVLGLLELGPDTARVAALSSDRGLGLAIVVERPTGRRLAAEEFCWNERDGWRIQRFGRSSGVVAAAGCDPDRAGLASIARVVDRQFPVEVSPEGWWALVVVIDGVDHPRLEPGLVDP